MFTFPMYPLVAPYAPVTPAAEAQFLQHLRSVNARETCATCDAGSFELGVGRHIYAQRPVITRICLRCFHVEHFVARNCGLAIEMVRYLDSATSKEIEDYSVMTVAEAEATAVPWRRQRDEAYTAWLAATATHMAAPVQEAPHAVH